MQRVHTTYLSEDITKKRVREKLCNVCVCVCWLFYDGGWGLAAVISHSGPSDKVFPE